jgi:hypothetical protein
VNTRLSKLITMAQAMTREERMQWSSDIAHDHGTESEQYKLVAQAIKQAEAVLA